MLGKTLGFVSARPGLASPGLARRFLASSSAAQNVAAAATAAAPAPAASAARSTLKPLHSRKTYLVDMYTHLLRANAVVLALHNSTLLLAEDKQLRAEIAKAGGRLTIVRSSLMRVALRGADAADPAALPRRDGKPHALSGMFVGPSALLTIPTLDPAAVDACIQAIDKSQNRLVLLGGAVQGVPGALLRPALDSLRQMPPLPVLHAQLAGVLQVLAGAGLTQTLEASSQMLALTLANRENAAGSERSE